MRRGSHGLRNLPRSLATDQQTKSRYRPDISVLMQAHGGLALSLCDMLQPSAGRSPGHLGMSFCYVFPGMPPRGRAQTGGESAKACANNS